MIFSKKKEVFDPYTVEQCTSCNAMTKRKFKDGDFIFQILEKCSKCSGTVMITKIFGEPIK
jgi:multimeric flavodoxin WrbA